MKLCVWQWIQFFIFPSMSDFYANILISFTHTLPSTFVYIKALQHSWVIVAGPFLSHFQYTHSKITQSQKTVWSDSSQRGKDTVVFYTIVKTKFTSCSHGFFYLFLFLFFCFGEKCTPWLRGKFCLGVLNWSGGLFLWNLNLILTQRKKR